jgi:hypothetical protein
MTETTITAPDAGICTGTAPGEVRQERVIREAPESAKNLLAGAFSGSVSPRKAIKAMCLVCLGYDRQEVKNCTARACPLWAYRPFQE